MLRNFARNSPAATSNYEVTSLQLQRLWMGSKSDRGKLCATFVWLWPCCRPRVPWPGPIDQVARLSETGVAFARSCVRGVETDIAFAGEKKLFLAWFSVAEVMVVSTVAVWGRALVMVVSRWSAAAVAEVSLVSKPTCRCVLCAKKFARVA